MLARLGGGALAAADAAELAGFFPVQVKGLLRRSRVVAPAAIKTPAQRNRRAALMEGASFDGFARALDLTPEALIAGWPWGDDALADRSLAAMAARSGADPVVGAMTDAFVGQPSPDPQALVPLLPRLGPARRREVTVRLLCAGRVDFATALALTGAGGIHGAIGTPPGAALLATLGQAERAAGAGELLALGLLSSRAGAREALERVAAAGLIASDPRLDMLRLNAALEHRGPDT